MSTRLMNFDPYVDYEAVTPEHAARLHSSLGAHRNAIESFLDDADPDLGKAALVLETAHAANRAITASLADLHVVPAMVHEAGEPHEEHNPEDEYETGTIQRCRRCGSILNFWHDTMGIFDPEHGIRPMAPEEVPWFEAGERVGKTNEDTGIGMYRVEPGRVLAKHERECADLSALSGD